MSETEKINLSPKKYQSPYQEKVMEHFQNPRNVGEIENPDGMGEEGNARCGDIMRITITVKDDRIKDIKFLTFGCVSAIATTSVLTEMVKGMKLDDALKITNQDIVDALGGLPPVKIHCSVLADKALKKAVDDYRAKQEAKA